MPLIFLLVGSALLISDRAVKRNTALIMKERLTYFIFYYRPHFHRRQFFGIILLAIGFSTLLDYLIFQKIDLLSHMLLLPLLVLLMYCLIFLLTIFDYFGLKKGDIAFNFFMFERECIQIFSLALFFPLIFFAYLLKTLLLMFLYPAQGVFLFRSFAGLAGGILLSAGIVLFLL